MKIPKVCTKCNKISNKPSRHAKQKWTYKPLKRTFQIAKLLPMKMEGALETEVDHPKIVGVIEHTQDVNINRVNPLWYQLKEQRDRILPPNQTISDLYNQNKCISSLYKENKKLCLKINQHKNKEYSCNRNPRFC